MGASHNPAQVPDWSGFFTLTDDEVMEMAREWEALEQGRFEVETDSMDHGNRV